MKSCESCYWKDYRGDWCIHKEQEPKEHICYEYDFICVTCDTDKAEYEFEEVSGQWNTVMFTDRYEVM